MVGIRTLVVYDKNEIGSTRHIRTERSETLNGQINGAVHREHDNKGVRESV
jgi:hypothetical protein